VGQEIAILIGPEGGLTNDEVEHARARGARTVTLGPRILRAETAGIVASTLVLSGLGELGQTLDALL
jgi:16S rRNA (uracil1498-N3)-methyltransferase